MRNPDETLIFRASFSTFLFGPVAYAQNEMTAVAPSVRSWRELRVIGSDLTEVVTIGAMLHAEFGYAALIHAPEPLARAASEEADLTVVLLKEPCNLDQASAVIEKSGAVIFVIDAPAECTTDLRAAGAFVLRPDQPALLEATVASLAAQVISARPEL